MNKLKLSITIFFLLLLSKPVFALKSAPWIGVDFKGMPCKGGTNEYGPYDYINPAHKGKEKVVERHHFTDKVEFLVGGESGSLAGDLNYTLVTLPNHHKALLSLIRYQIRLNKKLANNPPLKTPVECYFQRAINFSPKDIAVYSLYAYYLQKNNLFDKSKNNYIKALDIDPDNIKINYSYALLLIKMRKYDKAFNIAKFIYSHKNIPDGLKNQLVRLGIWK